MRTAITVLAILTSLNAFGQVGMRRPMSWNDQKKPKTTRVDTTYGTAVYAMLTVETASGMRIDSVETWTTQVGCPDEAKGTYFGCAVLHYGDVDFIKSTKYYTFDGHLSLCLNEKYLIKFIPE